MGLNKRKINDLSGQKFGRLTVLNRADNKITTSGLSHVMFHCICECGNTRDVRATYLRNGHTASCGCDRRNSLKGVNLEDLTGRKFGRWLVLYRAESLIEPSGRKATMWYCRCDCGTEKSVRAATLKNGLSKSCGCLKRDVLSKNRQLIGQTFGRWTVIDKCDDIYSEVSNRSWRAWFCRCECGTEREVSEQALITGKSLSCGCYRNERLLEVAEYVDLSGQKFGYWSVISRADDRFYPGGGRAQMWNVVCDCGQERIVAGNMLKSGISQSCGCKYYSQLEDFVETYLSENQYQYEQQKMYPDLIGVGGGLLSYDFLVFMDGEPYCLIECQGEQHYKPIKYFGGEAKFEMQKEHDSLKKKYAESLNLQLFEVSYKNTKYEDVVSLLDGLF